MTRKANFRHVIWNKTELCTKRTMRKWKCQSHKQVTKVNMPTLYRHLILTYVECNIVLGPRNWPKANQSSESPRCWEFTVSHGRSSTPRAATTFHSSLCTAETQGHYWFAFSVSGIWRYNLTIFINRLYHL